MRELALFAGVGGGILGGKLLGWRTVCAVERDAFCAQILAQRQTDGLLKSFPIWSDVTSFDGRPWRGIVDVVSGGFPCQDISVAGKGAGITGARSGLWSHMARIIGEVRPRFAFVENSPELIHRGLANVLSDLAELGYDARWCRVSALDVGAPHLRDRIWIMGHTNNYGFAATEIGEGATERVNNDSARAEQAHQSTGPSNECAELANTNSVSSQRLKSEHADQKKRQESIAGSSRSLRVRAHPWPPEPDVPRVVNGLPFRVEQIRAVGNAQVPRVAATAWRILTDEPEV